MTVAPVTSARERLNQLTPAELGAWAEACLSAKHQGQLLERLPRDPHQVAVALETLDQHSLAWGMVTATFPLMSVIKPFLLLYLLEQLGPEVVLAKVGLVPSQRPYNSVVELEIDQGWPRNPMINSGAICLANALPGDTPVAKCSALTQWLNLVSGAGLVLDSLVLAQVNSHPNWQNRALTELLTLAGRVESPQLALDTYNHICCLRATVTDLVKLGLVLAGGNPNIAAVNRQMVNGVMLTCGGYEASPQIMAQIGLPIKSGVSGALLAIIPQAGAIALYSPPLDAAGNSVWSLVLLEQITQALELSILA